LPIRVFELAKELGVTSKAIMDKCKAEGVEPIKNHMTVLKLGLIDSIRQWFSEGAISTAVETTEHVDVTIEKKKGAAQRKRRHGKDDLVEPAPAEAASEAPPVEAPVEGVEPELAPPAEPAEVTEAPAPVAEAVVAEASAAVVEAAPAPVVHEVAPEQAGKHAPRVAAPVAQAPAPVVEAPVTPVAPPVAPPPPVEVVAPVTEVIAPPPAPEAPPAPPPTMGEGPRVIRNQPQRPKNIKPAGPQVVPTPARMKGPTVVRFDGPEPEVSPRRYSTGSRSSSSSQQPPPSGPASSTGPRGARPTKFVTGDEEEAPGAKKGPAAAAAAAAAKKRSPRRKGGRTAQTVEGLKEWRDRDLVERSARLAAATGGTLRRHRAAVTKGKADAKPFVQGAVELSEPITVKTFSAATGIKSNDIIRKLMAQGTMVTINNSLSREVAEMLALEAGLELKIKLAQTAETKLAEELAQRPARTDLRPRAPIVTFLGHVDHGKTSLLDRIRSATVASGEEGGITQGIGSYRYDLGGKHVVFLDTPGHEAFTAMRARGANMTDVVVLVVAADDGVMPQTIEALNHAKAAKVPIVVALNKIDLPNINVQRALGQLAEHGLNPREWGGETEIIKTSATTGQGIDELVEVLSLEAELLELKADPTAPAAGWVVEARRDPNRGVVARMLVRDGTLHVGDVVLAGTAFGKVRQLADDRGRPATEAGPASPVEVYGLDAVPDAGERFVVIEDLSKARAVAEERTTKQRSDGLVQVPRASLENIFQGIATGKMSEVRLIVKADVQGSLEALLSSLSTLGNEQVRVTVLHSGVGGITEGDVLLSEVTGGVVVGFRVVPDSRARLLAEQKGVDIRSYRVIYQLLDDVTQAIAGKLAPETHEEVTGRATVREVFKVSKVGSIAGCLVSEGAITRSSKVRLIRDNVMVEDERTLESLRRFKDDVREVRSGLECGIKIAGYDDIKPGDVIEAYQTVSTPGKLG
jgi:translation initiation factor IF-2